jgi:hypothetical protein
VILAWAVVLLGISAVRSSAHVPGRIPFQGRVVVNGSPFEGAGAFKFALLDANEGKTLWSNDGSSGSGDEPREAVTLTVRRGLYAVHLGDDSLAGMRPLDAAVLRSTDIRLRVWFDDGSHGFQRLEPDQRLGAAPFALLALGVPDASITSLQLAPGAASASLKVEGLAGVPRGSVVMSTVEDAAFVEAGYVRSGNTRLNELWEPRVNGTPAAGRYRHTAVWTGSEMIVWGGQGNNSLTLSSGGRYNPGNDAWMPMATASAPSARIRHTAVWTGSRMVIWGGLEGPSSGNPSGLAHAGGQYDPVADAWSALPEGLPAFPGRQWHSAVWTGSEMILWGGADGVGRRDDGFRYRPSGQPESWLPVPATGAPVARTQHTALWTGLEMIVWGGLDATSRPLNSGGRFDPATGTWRAMTTTGAPVARSEHIAFWTGSGMIVWGGYNGASSLGDGGIYDPVTDTWTPLGATTRTRRMPVGVWTGRELIVWGGEGRGGTAGDGARYEIASGRWTAIPYDAALRYRAEPTVVWTGAEMVLFGGLDTATAVNLNETWIYRLGQNFFLYRRP